MKPKLLITASEKPDRKIGDAESLFAAGDRNIKPRPSGRELLILAPVIILTILVFLLLSKSHPSDFKPVETFSPAATKLAEIIATGLSVPWEMVFLPDGGILFTERAGLLKKLDSDTRIVSRIPLVRPTAEGGLLGLALDPQFSQNSYLYLYRTVELSGRITNQVVRFTFTADTLTDSLVILSDIPGSANHDGGRLAFGPDGLLYITTGDAQIPSLAQDKTSLAGKILRLRPDGSIPPDNPFGNAVYSYGHRNPQGLAWDDQGRLWSTEHGPSGLQSGYDELNLIQKGGNYGWPEVKGDQQKSGMISPVIHSGPADTWAPSGLTFHQKKLYFTGLRGQSLYSYLPDTQKLSVLYKNTYGRLRAVVSGPDGYLYLSTSNRDGRGQPSDQDDRIIKALDL